jgi:TPR repeat protein
MSSTKNASLPLQTRIHPKKSSNSLCINSLINDSKISVDSDTGTALPEPTPSFTLRVVNPDFYEEDNEPVHPANIQYKPTLNTSVLTSPEIKNATVQPQVPVIVVPTNSWQSNSKPVPSPTATADVIDQLQRPYNPSVVRKVSKTLVEQEYKKDLELLPPLEMLPPLLTMNESYLLSSTSENTNEATPIIFNHGNKVMTSLQTLASNAPTSPTSPKTPPPQLPQHHSDFLTSTSGKASPSVAQQSINAAVVITKPEQLTKSPDELDETELNHNKRLELAIDRRRQSRDLLSNETTSTRAVHMRNPSFTPSLTPSSILSPHMQQQAASSRYAKASYSLTNNPDAIKLYRTMALKTKDLTVQLTYAKYLLEVASLYDEKKRPFRPNLSLSLPLMKRPGGRRDSNTSYHRPSSIASSRRSSIDTHMSSNTNNFGSRRDSGLTQTYDEGEEASKRKKRKMLEEEGVRWIKRLAKEHVGEAAYLLALWYDRGMYGFRKSSTKALKYYEIAANQKVPEAMFAVGQYHEREQDYMTSFQLYEEAASLGLVEALYVS